MLTAIEKDCDSQMMTCSVDYANLFKGIISPITLPEDYEEDVIRMVNRHEPISYAIAKYIKKNI